MVFNRRVMDLEWRPLILILTPLSLIALFSAFTVPSIPFSTLAPLRSFIITRAFQQSENQTIRTLKMTTKEELNKSRMAICLVGGARMFEITGPSIMEHILFEYPNADLFLISPLDRNSYKLSYLKSAPNLAAVKIFEPKPIPETESEHRVLTAMNSPNGIQGLLQYFNLVEGCLKMIISYQQQHNFTYDWVIRSRVDGYWSGPLRPENFIPSHYVVPEGSSYGGLNDRLGIGDLNTSTIALSRLSLIPKLDSLNLSQLNSEAAFKAQLSAGAVPFRTTWVPFCIVTERQYSFPPERYGVPVTAMSSSGAVSGAKCRPCVPVCEGECVREVMESLDREWSWTRWENSTMALCDAHAEWDPRWHQIYRKVAGEKMAAAAKRIEMMKVRECSAGMEEMKRRSGVWDAPAADEICGLGIRD